MKNLLPSLFVVAIAALTFTPVTAAAAPPVEKAELTFASNDVPVLDAPVDHARQIAQPAQPSRLETLLYVVLGLSCLGVVINERKTTDKNKLVTKALPAANAANASDSIDLGTTTPGRIPDVELRVELPATPNLADTKSITLTVKDSADNSTFAAIADLPAITVGPGSGGTGGTAVDRRFKLPIGTRRYIRLDAAVEASGGDNTAKSTTLSLVF